MSDRLAWLGARIFGVALFLTGCSSAPEGAGGGLVESDPRNNLIEVRGYVLTPDEQVPSGALGYAVPIFTSQDQAAQFCPSFISQLSFHGVLDSTMKMTVESYGHTIQIAPFVWPVTSWSNGQVRDCKTLVEAYNLSSAKTFYTLAANAIRDEGEAAPKPLGIGPYILLARRVSGTMIVLDLSQAPPVDYALWLREAIQMLSDPKVGGSAYVTTSLRDKVRFYVFGAIPNFSNVLTLLIPGYATEHNKA